MKRTIRRTIVVEYESEESIDCERYSPLWWSEDRGLWVGDWPKDAEIRETVEEITEDSHMPPDGVSGRVDQ